MASEKVSFNLSISDLGKIQLLVDKGVYSSRTDFLTKAVVHEMLRNEDTIEKEKSKFDWTVGISGYSLKDFMKYRDAGEKISVFVIGVLIIDSKIPLNLAKEVIDKVVVHGKVVASDEVKNYLKEIS